jgi:hypothetical protein
MSERDPRKRSAAGTKMRRVFLAVRHGCNTIAAIGAELGLPPASVYTAVKYLCRAGYVARVDGGRRYAKYVALRIRAPDDRRGKAPGCRNRARNLGKSVLAMQRARWGESWTPHPRDSHPLAQAWTQPTGDD